MIPRGRAQARPARFIQGRPMYTFLDIFFWFSTPFRSFSTSRDGSGGEPAASTLGLMALTLFSWFGLGWFYGFGYCPSTDWHWQIKEAMGETGLPNSFIKYYMDRLTGKDWDPDLLDASVVFFGVAALGDFGLGQLAGLAPPGRPCHTWSVIAYCWSSRAIVPAAGAWWRRYSFSQVFLRGPSRPLSSLFQPLGVPWRINLLPS